MLADAQTPEDKFKSLIESKEKELRDINEYRIASLQRSVEDKEAAAASARAKLSKLKEDFQYNLKLLEERDAELERYDATLAQFKTVLRDQLLVDAESLNQRDRA